MSNKSSLSVVVSHLHKSFRLPHEQHSGVKQLLLSTLRRERKGYELQHVLNDVSFEIKQGDFFGIVGRNGSGKSTLLKLLAGIYAPDDGLVQVDGSLTPFIELGVGFNPELTGRENIYMNGALLGFSKTEMDTMYDDIVEFAELSRFMDQKLKNYSSGMQVRLAFSIAIRAKSDILLLDEVLAVGDEAFQQKCIDVFDEYKEKKKTIILVTHDMATVKKYCTKAILLDRGRIVAQGDPDKVASSYTRLNEVDEVSMDDLVKPVSGGPKITIDGSQHKSQGDTITLNIDWNSVSDQVKNIGVAIYKSTGEYVFGSNTILDDIDIDKAKSCAYSLELSLGHGSYYFKIGLFGETDRKIIFFEDNGPKFRVRQNDNQKWEGVTYLNHTWGF